MTITLVCVNSLESCSFYRHDVPRKKKITKSSEAGCTTETTAVSHCVLRSHMKQATLQFAVMSYDKKTPVTTSTSTPLKADAQQLLSKISSDVFCKSLRSFCECPPTTTLLVTNQSSPVISLSKISTPEQGAVKFSSALPSGVVPDGMPERSSLHHPTVHLPKKLVRNP